jgi:hypothetical protein
MTRDSNIGMHITDWLLALTGKIFQFQNSLSHFKQNSQLYIFLFPNPSLSNCTADKCEVHL